MDFKEHAVMATDSILANLQPCNNVLLLTEVLPKEHIQYGYCLEFVVTALHDRL